MDRLIERNKKGKKLLYVMLALATAFLFWMLFTGGSSRQLKVSRERLRIEPATQGIFTEYIPVSGEVLPVKSVLLDAPDEGVVEEVYTEDGKILRAGDPVLRLNNPHFEMDAMNRESQLLEQLHNLRSTLMQMDGFTMQLKDEELVTVFELKEARRLFEQQQSLFKEGAISRREYETAANQYEHLQQKRNLIAERKIQDSVFRKSQVIKALQSMQLVEKNLEFIKLMRDNLIVKAPVGGLLSAFHAEKGETKSKGENIGQIDVIDFYKVQCIVPENYISRVSNGMEARMLVADREYRLYIKKVFPEVKNGEFSADLYFEGVPPADLRRGQQFQIRLMCGESGTSLMIPRGGFYQHTGGRWVYVLNGSNHAQKRKITLGRQNPEYYEVKDGLKPGEFFISGNYDEFNNADELILY